MLNLFKEILTNIFIFVFGDYPFEITTYILQEPMS